MRSYEVLLKEMIGHGKDSLTLVLLALEKNFLLEKEIQTIASAG